MMIIIMERNLFSYYMMFTLVKSEYDFLHLTLFLNEISKINRDFVQWCHVV
jgi:hypothetical protein